MSPSRRGRGSVTTIISQRRGERMRIGSIWTRGGGPRAPRADDALPVRRDPHRQPTAPGPAARHR